MLNQRTFVRTKYIVFTLENCDEICINIKDIVSFNFDDITYDYRFYNDGWRNIFTTWPIVNSFSIQIKQSANKVHHQFGGLIKSDDSNEPTVFDRLTECHDITSIKLLDKEYKDLATFYVPYVEPKGAENSLGAPNILEKTWFESETFWENKELLGSKILHIQIKRNQNKEVK